MVFNILFKNLIDEKTESLPRISREKFK